MKTKASIQSKTKRNIFIIAFVLITFIALLYRLTIHADIYDEMINLGVSYRVALGQMPFYECWDSFQSGDILLAPFLWVFIKIVGSTGGIVLYSRLVYLCILVFTGCIIYFTVKRYFNRTTSFLLGYLFCFFQLYGLFYIWYDSSSIILLVLGCLFAYRGVNETRYNKTFIFLAGVFHGLMAFSYPSYILLAIFYFVLFIIYQLKTNKNKWTQTLFYLFGGITVVLLFLIYIFQIIGVKHFIIGVKTILSYRSISSGGGNIFYNIISSYFKVNSLVIIPTVLLLFVFHKALKQKKYAIILIIGILLTGVANQFTLDKSMRGLGNFMGYLALWGPCFYVLNKKNAAQINSKQIDGSIIYFLWLPSILSAICVAYLTVYAEQGPIKSWQGFVLAGMVTIWLVYNYLSNSTSKFNNLFCKLWIPLIICIMIANSYSYIYLNQSFAYSNHRMKEGIYKGIQVNTSLESMLDIQNMVLDYTKGKNTILAGNRLRSIYLMTNLLPCVPTTEGPCYYKDGKWHWDMTIKYFKVQKKYPDIMFLEPYEIENKQIKRILKQNYDFVANETIGEYIINVYIIKK